MDAQIAQKLCHMLASCEEATRTQALDNMGKLFAQATGPVDELTLLKITKALYYMLWMTDKPLKVRKVGVTIVETQGHFVDRANRLKFFWALFRSLSMEWPTLDKNRLDKMLLFVRIVVAGVLDLLNNGGWDRNEIEEFGKIVLDNEGIFNKRSMGLAFQFLQVFIDEFEANHETSVKKKTWSKLSAVGYLHLMKPFLHLAIIIDNRNILNTLGMYLLNRGASISGVPTDGYKLLVKKLAQSPCASHSNVKAMFEQLLEHCDDVQSTSVELVKQATEVVAAIELAVEGAKTSNSGHRKETKRNKSVAISEDVDMDDSETAPGLVDVSDVLEAEDYDMDDDNYINLADAFSPRRSNSKFGKHLKEVATLDTLRKYLVSSGQDKHQLLEKLNSPRMRRQMTLLALHNIRWLNPDRKFKCARKLHKIMTITETADNMPSRRRSIDVAKALHNIKHAKPEKSILRKRNRKNTETKHVVFNLKNNQVATIPKKTRSTLTMPMW